jgi:hypothetical protein
MFEKLCTTLIKALLLTYFNIDKHCFLETNTSDIVIIAIFSQLDLNSKWHLIVYFSKSIALAEINYSIYNKEILAIVQTFEHWQTELESTDYLIEVFIDYKVLKYFINTKVLSD